MSYAIAAYAVTVGTLAVYGWMLHHERRRLARATDDAARARRELPPLH